MARQLTPDVSTYWRGHLDTRILAGLLCCSTDPTPLKSDDPEIPASGASASLTF